MRRKAKRPTAGPKHRRAARHATGLLVAVLAVLVLAPFANASILTRAKTLSFGSDGTATTPFNDGLVNKGAAFDQASGRLYIVDGSHFTVQKDVHAFEAPANDLAGGAFPLNVVPAGGKNVVGFAVDNTVPPSASAGNFYVLNRTDSKLLGFDPSGTPLGGAFPVSLPSSGLVNGVAVDSAGNIYVGHGSSGATKTIRRYDSAGNFLGTIDVSPQGSPGDIAFDSEDNLFFSTVPLGGSINGVFRLSAASGYSQASASQLDWEATGSAQGLAVDTATDTVYVAGGGSVSALGAASGASLYDFATGIAGANFADVAVDEEADTVYVADQNQNFSNPGTAKVHVFGAAQEYADATGTPTPATDITDTSAEIGATIADNNVLQTNWRLELSPDAGESWETVDSGQTAAKSAVVSATGSGIGTLTVKAAGGTFSLIYEGQTTAPLTHNAPAASVQAALEELSTIGAGNVEVSGGPGNASGSTPYAIVFTGALSGSDVGKVKADPTGLVSPAETVSGTVTGLDPNTPYKFRVVTNKGTSEATEVASSALSFKTVAPPPVITDLGAIQVQDTSARLVGTIDPRNSETGYVFEYGTTPALGSSTPPLAIGSGTEEVTVSQVVGGLKADTDYYFRLVATNLTGTTTSAAKSFHTRAVPFPPASPANCPNQGVRAEQGTTHLPACRAYEMVSPPDKNQGSVDQFFWDTYEAGFARDGNAAAFCTNAIFSEPAGQIESLCAGYLSRRGPTGWQTEAPFPRHCLNDRDDLINARAQAVVGPYFDRAVNLVPESSQCPIASIVPGAPDSEGSLYWQDLTADPFEFELIAAPNPFPGGQKPVLGGSDDFDKVVFVSTRNLTPDSPAPEDDFPKLYEWERAGHGDCVVPGGCLALVSKDVGNVPLTTDSSDAAFGRQGRALPNDVSADGERVYFRSGTGSSQHVYMREGGTTTFDVSASECTLGAEACGADSSADSFVWASAQGDVALFLSCDRLTDESSPGKSCGVGAFIAGTGGKLYRWDRDAPPGNRLTDLTVDNEPADGIQPNALDVVGGRAGAGGDVVYFVTGGSFAANGGQIVAGEPAGSGMRLYRSRWNGGSPTTDYLGPYQAAGYGDVLNNPDDLDVSEDRMISDANARQPGGVRVTADGEYLMITTMLRLDPAGDRDAHLDVYRWDEEGGWLCISCQEPGTTSAGHVNTVYPSNGDDAIPQHDEPYYNITDDGERIFFSARDALVPGDVNGQVGCPLAKVSNPLGATWACQDIYEWHDGTLSLVTPGTGESGFAMLGATSDGQSLFFITRERLVGWDTDNGTDIYVARAGGGFPEPAPRPPECEGEGCREDGTDAHGIVGAGTGVFQGAGNLTAGGTQGRNRCRGGKLRRGKRCITVGQLARKRCRRLSGPAKRRCIRRQARRLRRAQRRAQRRLSAHRANHDRRAGR